MSGSTVQSPGRRTGRRVFAALLAFGLAVATVALTGGTASAAGKTVKTQLSLSGLANADNPLGGSVIGIHPGDKVSISSASVPTAGLDKLGLGDLVGGLLSGVLGTQSVANFSKLPGGKANTVLKGKKTVVFSFPREGRYTFSWQMQRLLLLGGAAPINLDGNQLEKAGVKLNASNQYVGTIVVAKNPPKGGLSLQLPSVGAHPKVGNVQLPKVQIPGLQTPTIQTPSVPNLNIPGVPTDNGDGDKGGSKSSSSGPNIGYKPPGLSIADEVVPNGEGAAGGSGGGSGGGGGLNAGAPDTGTGQVLANPGSGSGGSSAAAAKQPSAEQAGQTKTVELASQDPGKSSSQVPVILAILAIIALALVAGTYARLFLLKKQS